MKEEEGVERGGEGEEEEKKTHSHRGSSSGSSMYHAGK